MSAQNTIVGRIRRFIVRIIAESPRLVSGSCPLPAVSTFGQYSEFFIKPLPEKKRGLTKRFGPSR
jgi:hypothetical protein